MITDEEHYEIVKAVQREMLKRTANRFECVGKVIEKAMSLGYLKGSDLAMAHTIGSYVYDMGLPEWIVHWSLEDVKKEI